MIIDKEIFDKYTDVGRNFRWQRVKMFAEQATEDFLLPVLGEELLRELQDHLESSDEDDGLDEVLEAAQATLSLMTMYLAVPHLQVHQSDEGLHVFANDDYKSPYQWQVGDYREGWILAGYGAMEKLYRVLMKHAGQLPTWRDSDGYAGYNAGLLRTAKEFNRYYKIGSSSITFVDLKPALERAQDLVLRKVLGEAFYDSLIDWVRNGSESSDSDEVDETLMDTAVDKVRKALAHFTIGHSQEVHLRLVNGGLLSTRFDANSANQGNEIDVRLDAERASDTRDKANKRGFELLSLAQGWLDANADSFPLYKNGPGYRPGGNDERPVSARIYNAGGLFGI